MRFDYDFTLIVNLPKYVTKRDCEQFIGTNLQWILTHFEKSTQYRLNKDWSQFYLFGQWVAFDALLPYLDKSLELDLQKFFKMRNNSQINLQTLHQNSSQDSIEKESINLVQRLWQEVVQRDAKKYLQPKPKLLLIALYRQALKSYVVSRMGEISQAMQLFPSRIDYGKSYRQLGCCRAKDQSIRLSLRLALMPYFCIDSVIIHELAHLRYPNHKQDFWNLVRTFDDNPKRIDVWLRANSHLNAQLYQRIFK